MSTGVLVLIQIAILIATAILFFMINRESKAISEMEKDMSDHIDSFRGFLEAVEGDTKDIIEASEHAHRALDQIKHYHNQIQ